MTDITIYHNPACGTSRNTTALIRNSGAEPTVILYLETPPSRDELKKLIADMGIGVRDLLRKIPNRTNSSARQKTASAMTNCSMPCWLIRSSLIARW